MKKSFRKELLLTAVITLLLICFSTTAFAAPVKDTLTATYYFNYSGSNATLTKNTSSTQVWTMPDTVKYSNKTYTVTAIDNKFFDNSAYAGSVYSVTLPTNLKSIAQGTFTNNTDSIQTIEIPGTVTNSSDYFLGCDSLEEFIVNENNPNLKAVDGVLYKGETLQRFPAAKKSDDSTVYEIADGTTSLLLYSFHGVKYITDVKIPASVDTIKSGAFCDSSITGVHFENGSTYDVSTYVCYCDDSSKVKCADRITFCLEEEADAIEATCSAPGHTAGIRCDITGEWLTGEDIPQKEHDFNTTPSQTEPTCEKDAKQIFECAYNCGAKKEIIFEGTATGHKGGTATCTSLAVCETCGKEYGASDTDNHSFITYAYNNDATCEKDGTKTAVCANNCGKSDTVTVVGTALSHSYTYVYNNDATCEKDGTKTAVCANNCGKSDTVTVEGSAIGHSYTYAYNNDATCEMDGTKTAVCTNNCGKSDTVTVEGSALGHSYTYVYNNDATCEKNGTKTAVCANNCGKSDTVTVEGSALGHSYTSYTISRNATCECNAVETATCDNNCNSVSTREIPNSATGHISSSPVKTNIVAATCETNGSYTEIVSCLTCNKPLSSVNKTVPATGHADVNGDNICDNGGESLISPTDDCSHICHQKGFMGLIWIIVKLVTKLLGINPVCDCGVNHY